jgi:predicted nucleic acid-binding protein
MNPSGCVVDAGVAMKWLVAEELMDHARRLLEDGVSTPFFAPPLLNAEVTNALYQQRRYGVISAEELAEALEQFLALGVTVVEPSELYHNATEFAQANAFRAVYDSLYVVLARMLNLELWTADQRLLDALGPAAPWVRWIGDY